MTPAQVIVLAAAGFVAGAMNAVAGGGTIVTFPALIFSGMSSIAANATSTVALLPGTIGGVAGYRRNLPAARRWIRLFLVVSVAGGLAGGMLLVRTPERLFDALVPFLILFATVLFTTRNFFVRLFHAEAQNAAAEPSRAWTAGAIAFQFIVALYGGYFGAGIGILMLATLGLLGLDDIHEMNTVKGVLGFAINGVAAAYFVWSGLTHWGAAAVIAVSSLVGGYLGAAFAQRISQQTVRHLITGVGLLLAATMFWKQLRGR